MKPDPEKEIAERKAYELLAQQDFSEAVV